MAGLLSPVINAADLHNIFENENLVIIDASNGPAAKLEYDKKHLHGALYMDLNTQMAKIESDAANGGRHPLPDPEQFAKTLTSLGIANNSHVIIYDSKNSSNAAARLWWMLKAIGHEKVQVLNGGLQAAEKWGLKITNKTSLITTRLPYTSDSWVLPLVNMAEVEKRSQDENYRLIDVRDAYRYKGESEPIDLVAGHIPGAVNIPFTGNLDEEGLFLSPEILLQKYEAALKNIPAENIIVHCGSGVTACHTLLAMAYAGFAIPALYVGSWSEWSRNGKPIATVQ